MTETTPRYARQVACELIGEAGQARIRAATVLQVGCGALGTVQAELLVRAGVGRLIIVDRDVVELSNLQRQICFDEEDARMHRPKAEAAAAHLRRVNSEVEIVPEVLHLTPENVRGLVRRADLVMDATDNFETRYLLNDACVEAGIPWIYGGVLGMEGTVMLVAPDAGPCFRCLIPTAPDASKLPTIAEVGVLSTTVTTIASQQVTLALRALVNPDDQDCAVRVLDVWAGSLRRIPLRRNPDCPCCGRREFPFLAGPAAPDFTIMWARNAVMFHLRPDAATHVAWTRSILAAGGSHPNDGVWEVTAPGDAQRGPHTIMLFADGRVLVTDTRDPDLARSMWLQLT
ncbi:HesA/MoeB/ThiF family protein [Myxococcota bacterium]|nr:HesA/MoeB/ThiF family protein [Myxococcota bacterium]